MEHNFYVTPLFLSPACLDAVSCVPIFLANDKSLGSIILFLT